MKHLPYLILALIAAAGVQKFANRAGEPVPQLLTVVSEQRPLGEAAPFAVRTLEDPAGERFVVLSQNAQPAEIGGSFCAQVATGRLLRERTLTSAPAGACG